MGARAAGAAILPTPAVGSERPGRARRFVTGTPPAPPPGTPARSPRLSFHARQW
jgi:hypothetical protein